MMRRVSMAAWTLAASLCVVGCAGAHHSGKVTTSAAIAPDDLPRQADPNAQYRMTAVAPHLIARPTAGEIAEARSCNPTDLSVEEVAASVNGAYRSVRLAFINRGPKPCTLGGYPRVALLNSAGAQLAGVSVARATRAQILAEISDPSSDIPESAAPAQATLMPEASAAFQLVWKTGPTCPEVAGLSVAAPGSAQSFSLTHPTRVCPDPILITRLWFDAGAV